MADPQAWPRRPPSASSVATATASDSVPSGSAGSMAASSVPLSRSNVLASSSAAQAPVRRPSPWAAVTPSRTSSASLLNPSLDPFPSLAAATAATSQSSVAAGKKRARASALHLNGDSSGSSSGSASPRAPPPQSPFSYGGRANSYTYSTRTPPGFDPYPSRASEIARRALEQAVFRGAGAQVSRSASEAALSIRAHAVTDGPTPAEAAWSGAYDDAQNDTQDEQQSYAPEPTGRPQAYGVSRVSWRTESTLTQAQRRATGAGGSRLGGRAPARESAHASTNVRQEGTSFRALCAPGFVPGLRALIASLEKDEPQHSQHDAVAPFQPLPLAPPGFTASAGGNGLSAVTTSSSPSLDQRLMSAARAAHFERSSRPSSSTAPNEGATALHELLSELLGSPPRLLSNFSAVRVFTPRAVGQTEGPPDTAGAASQAVLTDASPATTSGSIGSDAQHSAAQTSLSAAHERALQRMCELVRDEPRLAKALRPALVACVHQALQQQPGGRMEGASHEHARCVAALLVAKLATALDSSSAAHDSKHEATDQLPRLVCMLLASDLTPRSLAWLRRVSRAYAEELASAALQYTLRALQKRIFQLLDHAALSVGLSSDESAGRMQIDGEAGPCDNDSSKAEGDEETRLMRIVEHATACISALQTLFAISTTVCSAADRGAYVWPLSDFYSSALDLHGDRVLSIFSPSSNQDAFEVESPRARAFAGLIQDIERRAPFLFSIGLKQRVLRARFEEGMSAAREQHLLAPFLPGGRSYQERRLSANASGLLGGSARADPTRSRSFAGAGADADDRESSSRLRVVIRRDALVEDSVESLLDALEDDRLELALLVQWLGEEGVDGGGPRREWLCAFIAGVLGPASSGRPSGNAAPTLQEMPEEHALTLGIALGLAVRHQVSVEAEALPPAVYNLLLDPAAIDAALSLQALDGVDAELATTLAALPHASLEDLRNLARRTDDGGNADDDDLSAIEAKMRQAVLGQDDTNTRALCYGFSRVLSQSVSLLHAQELRSLVTGVPLQQDADPRPNLDADSVRLLRSVTRHQGFSPSDEPLKAAFWAAWTDGLSDELRVRLLSFITGAPRLPLGWERLAISGRADRHLLSVHLVDDFAFRTFVPWASTCTMTLFIPRMPPDELTPRLSAALAHADGFGLK